MTNRQNSSFPPPHSAKNETSFAYRTIKDRLPKILVRVSDSLCQHKNEIHDSHGEDGLTDIKAIIGRMAKLRNELMTDKIIIPLCDTRSDVSAWNAFLDELISEYSHPSWFSLPWLYVECYMYRRIQEAVELSETLQTLDVFGWQKCEAFQSSIESIYTLGEFMDNTLACLDTDDLNSVKLHFQYFLYIDLWGNKCDLSITGGVQYSHTGSPLDQLTQMDSHIVADDTSAVWSTLITARQRKQTVTLHLVLDNAGLELFADFCLLEFLTRAGLVDRVHLHGKPFPWFISDVTRGDLDWTLNELTKCDHPRLSAYGQKWTKNLTTGVWTYSAHDFWCMHFDYSLMSRYAPDLYEALSDADLVVFKGDLNYRKLTGDLIWDTVTPFTTSLRGFNPAPLCTLRTLKADVLVGLAEGQEGAIGEIDENWRTSGDWAVVQFAAAAAS